LFGSSSTLLTRSMNLNLSKLKINTEILDTSMVCYSLVSWEIVVCKNSLGCLHI
jgi:hypothetical protein